MDHHRKRTGAPSDDSPVYSRLFVVCGKNMNEADLREPFSKFGTIEDFFFPKDFTSGASKGIAFVKFAKTSEAAKAMEALNMKCIPNFHRPLKVLVATNRNEVQSEDDYEKYVRLFIYVAKTTTEDELMDHFGQFGTVESINIQKDRDTLESKGFAYIKYMKFSQAAIAFEECNKKYRAVFAQPKASRKLETAFETNINSLAVAPMNMRNSLASMMNVQPEGYTRIFINCSPFLTYYHIKQLFDIVPGMIDCHYAVDLVRDYGKGSITYSSEVSAAYAVRKLNQFEYPPGQQMFVEPDYGSPYSRNRGSDIPRTINNLKSAMNSAPNCTPDLARLAEAIAEASKVIKVATAGISEQDIPDSDDLNYCSVKLPQPKPLADIDSEVVKRCFLVCKPQPPPQKVLRDIFCRFGDLINVYTLPNKTVGYARFASVNAADEAMKTLHGAEICGVRIKVLEAEEEDKSAKRTRYD